MSTEAEKLLQKYRAGQCTPEELEQLKGWFHELNLDQPSELTEEDLIEAKGNFAKTIIRPKRMWPKIAVAASIICCCSIAAYFALHQQQPAQTIADNQIKPGTNKAILTLSNGKEISLNDAQNGTIAKQQNTTIQKTADGVISYISNQKDTATQFNTMHTPRGGRYEGTLSDGTHFILDAASTIKYPVQFNKTERIVEVSGQAWFEVKHDPSHPFKVLAKGQTIEDIGTQFNINAYDDEPVQKNTLIEGSIKITKENQSVILKPGQQSTITSANNKITVSMPDISEAIAWKNGKITFNNEDLQTIMRQVSRWYNIDIKYEGHIPNREFQGGLLRNANFNDFLKILSFYNIHYTLNNRTLTITP